MAKTSKQELSLEDELKKLRSSIAFYKSLIVGMCFFFIPAMAFLWYTTTVAITRGIHDATTIPTVILTVFASALVSLCVYAHAQCKLEYDFLLAPEYEGEEEEEKEEPDEA